MRLSERIYNKKDFKAVKGIFGAPPGYETSDVEVFLDEIVVEVEKMEKQMEDLRIENKKLLEDQKIDTQILKVEEQEELQDLKEKLKRSIEQYESLCRAQKQAFATAEQIAYDMKKLGKEKADAIIEEAKNQANGLMKKVDERCAEKERELQRLEGEEKRLRDQFGEFAKIIQTAVNKN